MDDINGLSEEEKFYADRFNINLREKLIDELVIYEGNKIIQDIKNDEAIFREKIEIMFINSLRGYKDMPTKTLIDIYIDKCGEEGFIDIIESISS